MLTTKDVTTIQGMLDAQAQGLEKRLTTHLEARLEDTERRMRDETRSLISASEHRVTTNVTTTLRGEMHQMEKRIVSGVNDLIGEKILPQIGELQKDVALLKRHTRLA